LDQLLETTDSSDFVGNQIILTSYNKYMVGLAVQEVFEVRTFEISKVELLPPLIEQVRRRDIAWALLRLDEPLVLDVSNNQETVIQAGELLVIVDLSRLFYSTADQGFEDWLIQAEATYSQVII
jgi:chemotaxis signal transduction protein